MTLQPSARLGFRPQAWAAALSAAVLAVGGCSSAATPTGAPPVQIFARTGMGDGQLSYPRAAVAAPDGNLYIVDKSGRIQVFSPAGNFVRGWRMPESAAGKPTGLGAGPCVLSDAEFCIYAADTHYGRVTVFDPLGTLVGQFGTFGEGPGQFKLPTDVAVDRGGNVYVGEYGGNDRVNKFSPELEYMFSFGGPGAGEASLSRPQSLLVGPDQSLWVADAAHHRVCHFDAQGQFLGAFGQLGHEAGDLRFPYGLEMLPDGTLAVCEYGNNRVQRFSIDGASLGTWGAAGRDPGLLAFPWAVALAPDERLYIIDSGNNRVQVIAPLARGTWAKPATGL